MTDGVPAATSFKTDEGHAFVHVDGKMHSVDDAPAVIYADGARWWYREGKIHRIGGPAVIFPNGVEEWWQNNQRHRPDGPAIIYPDTDKVSPELCGVKQWWAHGRLIREEVPPKVQAYRNGMEVLRKQHFGA